MKILSQIFFGVDGKTPYQLHKIELPSGFFFDTQYRGFVSLHLERSAKIGLTLGQVSCGHYFRYSGCQEACEGFKILKTNSLFALPMCPLHEHLAMQYFNRSFYSYARFTVVLKKSSLSPNQSINL